MQWCEVVERFYSRWEGEGSKGVDGLAQPWEENVWLVPPFSQLSRAVAEVVDRGRHVTMVVPNWASAWRESLLIQTGKFRFPRVWQGQAGTSRTRNPTGTIRIKSIMM